MALRILIICLLFVFFQNGLSHSIQNDASPALPLNSELVLSGSVLDENGLRVSGAKLYSVVCLNMDKNRFLGVTDDNGRFQFPAPFTYAFLHDIHNNSPQIWRASFIVAVAPDGRINWVSVDAFRIFAEEPVAESDTQNKVTETEPVVIRLPKPGPVVRGRLVDQSGKPLVQADIRVMGVLSEVPDNLDEIDFSNALGIASGWMQVLDEIAPPISSDDAGWFELPWIGERQAACLIVTSELATKLITVFDREPVNRGSIEPDLLFWGPEFTVTLESGNVVRGVVTDATSGHPVANVDVTGWEVSADSTPTNRSTTYRSNTKTDEQGRYAIKGLSLGRCQIGFAPPSETALLTDSIEFLHIADQPSTNIALKQGRLVRVKATDSVTGKTVPALVVCNSGMEFTDDDGFARFVVTNNEVKIVARGQDSIYVPVADNSLNSCAPMFSGKVHAQTHVAIPADQTRIDVILQFKSMLPVKND